MGKPAYNCLSLLIQSYNKYNDGELDKGFPERADKAAKNTKYVIFKYFFIIMGAVIRASRPNNNIIQQIYHLYVLKNLVEVYIKLIAKVSTEKPTAIKKEKKKRLLEEFKNQDYSTDTGQD